MVVQRLLSRVGVICLLAAMPVGLSAHAQNYPAGPVKFITQLAAGGGTDPAMRIVIDHLGRMWGQQTTLVNQPGAGGAIAARAAASAAPDGYTLYMNRRLWGSLQYRIWGCPTAIGAIRIRNANICLP